MNDTTKTRKRIVVADDPGNAERFERTVRDLLTVDKTELARREAEYQRQRAGKDRPGPRTGHRRKTA